MAAVFLENFKGKKMENLCVNCKFCKKKWFKHYCSNPNKLENNNVTGKSKMKSCTEIREIESTCFSFQWR